MRFKPFNFQVHSFIRYSTDSLLEKRIKLLKNQGVPEPVIPAVNQRKQFLPNIHHTILVASAKGGVGKSTLSGTFS